MEYLVLSFLLEYNGETYKRGDCMDVSDTTAVKSLVRERCISVISVEEPKKTEKEEFPSSASILNASEKADLKGYEKNVNAKKQNKKVNGGTRTLNVRNNKL